MRRSQELNVDWGARRIEILAFAMPRQLSYRAVLIEPGGPKRALADARKRLQGVLLSLPFSASRTLGEAADTCKGLAVALQEVIDGMVSRRQTLVSDGTLVWQGEASMAPLDRWRMAASAWPEHSSQSSTCPTCSFTGVVVDARGLDPTLRPSFFPRVRSSRDEVLLEPTRSVLFCPKVAGELSALVGETPLVVKARARTGLHDCDPIIGEADAAALSAAFPGGRAKLLILLEPEGAEEPLPF